MGATLSGLLSVLTTGASGGIVGGILALFRTAGERKERLALKEIELKRDQAEYADARAREQHQLTMLEKGAQLELEKTQTEGEIAADLAHQQTLSTAQVAEFQKLNTSRWMDNWRASVRVFLGYSFTAVFFAALFWAFGTYRDDITADQGLEILIGLFATLEFGVSSVISFYLVARANAPARR